MTAYRFVTLTCDGCGEIFDPGVCRLVREARRQAARIGWVSEGGQDRCGVCEGTHYRFEGHVTKVQEYVISKGGRWGG